MVIIREITTVHILHNAVVQPSCNCCVHIGDTCSVWQVWSWNLTHEIPLWQLLTLFCFGDFFIPRPPLRGQVLRRFPALCVNKIYMWVWVGISPAKEQSAASQWHVHEWNMHAWRQYEVLMSQVFCKKHAKQKIWGNLQNFTNLFHAVSKRSAK